MKNKYLATVCFTPVAAWLVGHVAEPWLRVHPWILNLVIIYQVVGLFILLIGLWRSDRNCIQKILWPLALVHLALLVRIPGFRQWEFSHRVLIRCDALITLIALPAYWFFVLRTEQGESTAEASPKVNTNGEGLPTTVLKMGVVVLFGVAFGIFWIPAMHIEALQNCAFRIVALWPMTAPALLVLAVLCFAFRRRRWMTVPWIIGSGPVVVFISLLIKLMVGTAGGSGPDGGFVGMATAFALLFSLYELIPGLLLLCACPPKSAWRRTSLLACVLSSAFSIAALRAGIFLVNQWETVPPASESGATAFAENYIRSESAGSFLNFGGQLRKPAFVSLLRNPRSSASTLLAVVRLLPDNSAYWQDLIGNPALPEEIFRLKHNNPQVGAALATNPNLPPADLKVLAESSDARVRMAVAHNKSTPRESLIRLAYDRDWMVRDYARQNLGPAFTPLADAGAPVSHKPRVPYVIPGTSHPDSDGRLCVCVLNSSGNPVPNASVVLSVLGGVSGISPNPGGLTSRQLVVTTDDSGHAYAYDNYPQPQMDVISAVPLSGSGLVVHWVPVGSDH